MLFWTKIKGEPGRPLPSTSNYVHGRGSAAAFQDSVGSGAEPPNKIAIVNVLGLNGVRFCFFFLLLLLFSLESLVGGAIEGGS